MAEAAAAPRPRGAGFDAPALWAATGAHFLNDFYVAFLAPLLPLVVARFNLSLALAGLLATVLTTSAAMSQPFFGVIADRLRVRIFVVAGPTLTVATMGLMGLAPSYAWLIVLLLLAGTGTASFHPQGASTAGEASGRRKGAGLSLFVAAGELGYALGPLVIVIVVASWGLGATWMVAVPGVLASLLLWRLIPPHRDPPPRPAGQTLRRDLLEALRPLAVLWFIVVLRSIVISSYQTFIPLLLNARGGSIVAGGVAVFLFGGIGAIGGISGGTLSDRLGRKRMMALSLILSTPLLFAFIHARGPWAYVFLAAGGVAIYLSAAVTIVMAQELMPHRASVASSIVMGLAWGTAGLSLTAVGALGDAIGLERTLIGVLGLSGVALVAVLFLPAAPRAGSTPA
ncbi:MAG: MFS transporter [Armatimonadota bacterium]|nr:MFS transporter [Armatimonadota bacterium]MDR7451178.1 MFS transporter [Armatimonadota bacterium]MDR7467217.1 MFS transporter [Armatimonadota bacterium]MDR7494855.1 MFS transporter [Armatimonadota bacterium]MDR7504555.1 MFS transporter [Armatimonadota bacterium]